MAIFTVMTGIHSIDINPDDLDTIKANVTYDFMDTDNGYPYSGGFYVIFGSGDTANEMEIKIRDGIIANSIYVHQVVLDPTRIYSLQLRRN